MQAQQGLGQEGIIFLTPQFESLRGPRKLTGSAPTVSRDPSIFPGMSPKAGRCLCPGAEIAAGPQRTFHGGPGRRSRLFNRGPKAEGRRAGAFPGPRRRSGGARQRPKRIGRRAAPALAGVFSGRWRRRPRGRAGEESARPGRPGARIRGGPGFFPARQGHAKPSRDIGPRPHFPSARV